MRKLFNTEYFKWGATAFVSLSAVVILFMVISRASGLAEALGSLMSILSPFFYGIIIAYLVRPVFNASFVRTEKLVLSKGGSRKVAGISANVVGVVVSMVIFLGAVVGLCIAIFPQLIRSVIEIILSIPTISSKFMTWLNGVHFIDDGIKALIANKIGDIFGNLDSWGKTVIPNLTDYLSKISTGIVDVVRFFFNLIVGIIVAVYILLSKNRFSAQAKKISFGIFKEDTANAIIRAARYTDKVFNNFVVGNLIDALIIGVITLIVMTFFNWPFVFLVAAIVGVTNLIPFFGPFIGGGIGAVLILTENPIQALFFLLYVLIIQQIDGNIIKPKVLGAATDLSSFWVLFAIIAGGGLFGLWGVLLGVPVFTLVYAFIQWFIDRRLENKNMPAVTEEYFDIDLFDEETGTFSKLPEDYLQERSRSMKEERKQKREKKKSEK